MAKTVLIVDDSASLRTVVRLALVRAGYDVIEAADGVEGLSQLDGASKVHLIVSDVNMPKMDGIAFVTQVSNTRVTSSRRWSCSPPKDKTAKKSKAVPLVPRHGSSSHSIRRSCWMPCPS